MARCPPVKVFARLERLVGEDALLDGQLAIPASLGVRARSHEGAPGCEPTHLLTSLRSSSVRLCERGRA
jgi:hypothetical protein